MNKQAILNILWKLAPLCSRKEIEDATAKILTAHDQGRPRGKPSSMPDVVMVEINDTANEQEDEVYESHQPWKTPDLVTANEQEDEKPKYTGQCVGWE